MTKFTVQKIDDAGNFLVAIFHRLALFAIGAATVWSAAFSFMGLLEKPSASITDLLLLFIYLEIGAMVGIYFKTNHMPVRFLLYIAITALTRHIVDILSHIPFNMIEMLAVTVSILIVSLSVFIVKYTSYKFSGDTKEEM